MALHPRTKIRAAVVAALLAANTAAGSRVAASRYAPYTSGELPAIGVYCAEESVDLDGSLATPREFERHMELVVEGVVLANEAVDDALDALALEIEQVFNVDRYLGDAEADPPTALAEDTTLLRTEILEGEQGERAIGVVRLTYDVAYLMPAVAVEDPSTLDNFLTGKTRWNLGGVQAPADQAEDTVSLEAAP